jgi:SAM-dependent methyltransferase
MRQQAINFGKNGPRNPGDMQGLLSEYPGARIDHIHHQYSAKLRAMTINILRNVVNPKRVNDTYISDILSDFQMIKNGGIIENAHEENPNFIHNALPTFLSCIEEMQKEYSSAPRSTEPIPPFLFFPLAIATKAAEILQDEEILDRVRNIAKKNEIIHAKDLARYLFQFFPTDIPTNYKVVDIGAKDGVCTTELSSYINHNVEAYDLNPRKNDMYGPECVNVTKLNILDIPSEDILEGSVDMAIASNLLHKLSIPEQRIALKNLNNILKPGGSLIIIAPLISKENQGANLMAACCDSSPHAMEGSLLNEDRLVELLRDRAVGMDKRGIKNPVRIDYKLCLLDGFPHVYIGYTKPRRSKK